MTKAIVFLVIFFSFGFVLPEQHHNPVQGATSKDWNPQSFWYYPWGRNRVHKGIDIFAKAGTPVVAPTAGFILFTGELSMGGNVVYMIGPKWRFHYFAHLKESTVHSGFVHAGQKLGAVGSTGNARGKAPHLHYSIKSMFPLFWHFNTNTVSAWDRLFFVDPGEFIQG